MTRLILRLFGIKDFEPCKSCETLMKQLEFERAEKQQLTETLLNILNPKIIIQEAVPTIVQPLQTSAGLFSRKRAALEARDREEARIKSMSPNLGKPDQLKDIEKLEKELGVEETKEA